MRIIVTGGAGFIGSHVADAYLAAGHSVLIIDNLSKGFRENINPKATFVHADIRNLARMHAIFKKFRPEVVNHLAALAEVVRSVKDPIPTYATNVLGTANLLLAFGNYGRGNRKKFIFSSTGGAIYGEPKSIIADERTPALPLAPYGLSKLLAEETIKFYARSFGFHYLALRYANVYGQRQNPKGEAGVVAIFGGLMKKNKRPTIFGDGTKTRDYVYVGDVVRANVLGLRKGNNEVVNIGCGKEISDETIFSAVAKYTGFNGKPIYASYRRGEVHRIALNSKKAKKVLGWQPKVTLSEGIKRAVAAI